MSHHEKLLPPPETEPTALIKSLAELDSSCEDLIYQSEAFHEHPSGLSRMCLYEAIPVTGAAINKVLQEVFSEDDMARSEKIAIAAGIHDVSLKRLQYVYRRITECDDFHINSDFSKGVVGYADMFENERELIEELSDYYGAFVYGIVERFMMRYVDEE